MGIIAVLTIGVLQISMNQSRYVDLDASSCLDQIISSVGMLTYLRYGEHPKYLEWFLHMIN